MAETTKVVRRKPEALPLHDGNWATGRARSHKRVSSNLLLAKAKTDFKDTALRSRFSLSFCAAVRWRRFGRIPGNVDGRAPLPERYRVLAAASAKGFFYVVHVYFRGLRHGGTRPRPRGGQPAEDKHLLLSSISKGSMELGPLGSNAGGKRR